jgi:PAS domain S-box-containing protein
MDVFYKPGVSRSMTDDTKYDPAEIYLEESETHFRDFCENANDIIYIHDLKGNYLFFNRAAENIFGYTPAEMRSMNMRQVIAPEYLPLIRRRLAEKTNGKSNNTIYEVECLTKAGRRITLEVNSRPISRNGAPFAIQGIARDITERKRTQEALRTSEEQYRDLYENANDLIYTHDLKGSFTSLNHAGERITGYTCDEALQGNISDIVAPEFLETARKMTRRKIAGETTPAYELKMIAKDGRSIWLELNTRLIIQDGQPVGIQGIGRDVTERMRAETQSRVISEIIQGVTTTSNLDELLELIYVSLKKVLYAENCYVALYDEKTDLLHIPFCRDKYDEAAPSQKLGKGLTAYVMHQERPMLLSATGISQLISEGEIELVGTPPALWLGVPLRTPAGVIGVLVVQHYEDPDAYGERDLELLVSAGDQIALAIERKRSGEELAEANQRAIREYDRLLKRLATLAQETGAARDLATIFTALLGFAKDSVPCSSLFISLYDRENATREIIYLWYNGAEKDVSEIGPVIVADGSVGRALRTGEVIIVNDYQERQRKKPNNVYLGYDEDSREPQATIVAPMKIMGNSIGVVEVQSYDINAYTQEHATAISMAANMAANAIENVRLWDQEKQRAEQLRESQKLESVGRLAGGIAHDFNNMLTAITGYSDLTLRRLSSEDPLRKNIEEIKKAGERSASLTQQLLAFSRRQMLKPRILDINHEIEEIGSLLKRLIGEDIRFVTKLAPGLGRVEVDPGQLTQVLLNLAVNSRDAMPGGGTLSIETGNVLLAEQAGVEKVNAHAGGYVMITVSDQGEGMSPETQEHIFEPFFTTKELGKGTGMGLATVYGIIKQSGGQISVQSELGKGTTFKIYLPRIDNRTTPSITNNTPDRAYGGTETVLLVEDEEMVRNLARDVLLSYGYTVLEAKDGAEALTLCRQPGIKFDLVVSDVVMPILSGRQLAEELRTLRPAAKVLFMSGYTDDEVFRQGIVKTGDNFIQKPFALGTFAEKVRQLLDK